jgi:hypothetical protein
MDYPNAVFNYSELVSLRKIEAEFWTSLEKNLQQSKCFEKVNLRPLIKVQKSLNNAMMKMIAHTATLPSPMVVDPVYEVEKLSLAPKPIDQTMDSVDEAEGPRKDH